MRVKEAEDPGWTDRMQGVAPDRYSGRKCPSPFVSIHSRGSEVIVVFLFEPILNAAARGKELLVSIVRLSSLSTVELLLLGNNLDAAARCAAVSRKRTNRRIVRAV